MYFSNEKNQTFIKSISKKLSAFNQNDNFEWEGLMSYEFSNKDYISGFKWTYISKHKNLFETMLYMRWNAIFL